MRLTGSKIDLARRCLWPFRPDAGEPNAPPQYATSGQDEHGYIEHTLRTGDVAERSPTHARWLREWYADSLPPEHEFIEQPVAMCGAEARLGPTTWDKRDYVWAPWPFVAGTADYVTRSGDELDIFDWKTGDAGHVTTPDKSGQMLFLAAAFARGFASRVVRVHFVFVNERRLWCESATLRRLDMELFRIELARLIDALGGSPAATPGHWCRSLFCGYLGRCPETSGALTRLAPYPGEHLVALHSADITGPEHAGWQWALCQAAAKRLDEARTAAIMWLKAEPGRAGLLPGGGVVEMETTSRETVDAERALPVLREMFGQRADEAVETKISVTKGRVEDLAVESRREGESKAEAKRRVLGELRAAGAMRMAEYQTPKEREPSV